MKEVAAAHSCLSDPSRRAEYDLRLAGGSDPEEEEFAFDLHSFFAFMFEMERSHEMERHEMERSHGHGFHC